MAAMNDSSPLNRYLRALQQSGLVESSFLRLALEDFKAWAQTKGLDPLAVPPGVLAEFLEARKFVTPWQNEKLLQGRFKGFFLGKYKLLGHVGWRARVSVFCAERAFDGRRVHIRVSPSDDGRSVRYDVTDAPDDPPPGGKR